MNNEYRLYIYAFLSRVMSDIADRRFISDLKNNVDLLEIIGEETKDYILSNDIEKIYDELNIDYTSMYILNTQPVESFILDAKNETLVGLQNPVMSFYFTHGFEVSMDQTHIMAPDHLSIEFAFMQTLVYKNDLKSQYEFLSEHIIGWVIPYMMGMRSMALTPFYKDMCDFVIEFITSDYQFLQEAGIDV